MLLRASCFALPTRAVFSPQRIRKFTTSFFSISLTLTSQVNELFSRELIDAGYAGVEIRNAPMRTEIIVRASRPQDVLGDKGKRIRELTAVISKRFGFAEGAVELFAERVQNRGLSAQAQADSLKYKLLGGLAVRRACYGVMRFVMESGAKGVEVVVAGKLRGQRAKAMKFRDGYMVRPASAAALRCAAPLYFLAALCCCWDPSVMMGSGGEAGPLTHPNCAFTNIGRAPCVCAGQDGPLRGAVPGLRHAPRDDAPGHHGRACAHHAPPRPHRCVLDCLVYRVIDESSRRMAPPVRLRCFCLAFKAPFLSPLSLYLHSRYLITFSFMCASLLTTMAPQAWRASRSRCPTWWRS